MAPLSTQCHRTITQGLTQYRAVVTFSIIYSIQLQHSVLAAGSSAGHVAPCSHCHCDLIAGNARAVSHTDKAMKVGLLLAPEVGLPHSITLALAGLLLLSQQARPQPLQPRGEADLHVHAPPRPLAPPLCLQTKTASQSGSGASQKVWSAAVNVRMVGGYCVVRFCLKADEGMAGEVIATMHLLRPAVIWEEDLKTMSCSLCATSIYADR